jgi:DNA-binding GntR family transcriptional regulator
MLDHTIKQITTQRRTASVLPKTISSHIFDDLRQRIIRGDFRAGQPLREEEIRDLHGSSRGPIRESLRLLLQTGLVEHAERRGFRVRSYSAQDIRQIYRLRAMLEAQVFAELATLDLDPLWDPMDLCFALMESAWAAGDLDGYFVHKRQYLMTLIDHASNHILGQTLNFVNEVSLPVRYRTLVDQMRNRTHDPVPRHRLIAQHLKDGDFAQAERLTSGAILDSMEHAVRINALIVPDGAAE